MSNHQPRSVGFGSSFCRACRVATIASLTAFSLVLLVTTAPGQENLAELVAAARQEFRPVSSDQIASAREDLMQRMYRLEQFVNPMSDNGQRWLRFLRWDGLHAGLSEGGASAIAAFDATLRQLRQDENGLELAQFRHTAQRLEHYRNLFAVSLWESPSELYGRQLDALERDLLALREDRTPALEASVGQRLHILADLGQAERLVSAVRREHVRPNAYVDFSTKLVAAGIEPIRRNEQITDNILGTRIRGNANTLGNVSVSAVPAADRMVVEFISHGRTHSENVGRNGPAVIRATAHTDFTATKRVELSDARFTSQPARADATSHSDIHSISKQGGGLGSRFVSQVGWQRARQNHGRADAIAADHAEDRIERQFNRELDDRISDARQRYEREFRRPMLRRDEFPQHIRFSSSGNLLSVEATQADTGQLGASNEPPPAPGGFDATLRLHETAVNNYVAIFLSGVTASEMNPDAGMKFDVKLPNWMKDAWQQQQAQPGSVGASSEQPAFKPWSMTFRPRPVSVAFQDGSVELTTHIAQLKSGDQTFSDWDIKGRYLPELVNGGIVLRREGELTVLPANFRGTLTSRQTAERSNLQKEINERSARGRGFPDTIRFDPIEPEGPLAAAGPLEVREVSSDDHWISLALDRQTRYASP